MVRRPPCFYLSFAYLLSLLSIIPAYSLRYLSALLPLSNLFFTVCGTRPQAHSTEELEPREKEGLPSVNPAAPSISSPSITGRRTGLEQRCEFSSPLHRGVVVGLALWPR
ncbi:hypothetical protein C8R47DRAFT_1146606 [Mycena vitilis]|nr:hypothetical protein C8R47DRAFT_1170499 [Mycena vitilis]KAJ6467166.1 hypothetical protein C8R47DRAFT_1152869 [Mycena vitilis]KAJ6472124.1 hypothetical protein C8R47DRAFT_1146606 [Mycena vitilis]